MIEYWQTDEKAGRIRQLVVELGEQAVRILDAALESVAGADPNAASVLRAHEETDALHQAIHAHCAHYVAGASPLVKDLRFIVPSLQVATDLERIADQAVEMALAGAPAGGAGSAWPVAAVCDLGTLVEQQVRDVLLAFAASSVPLARQCSQMEQRLETEIRHLTGVITDVIGEHGEQARVGVRLITVIQTLERIATQAMNIARWVVFTETGERPRRLRALDGPWCSASTDARGLESMKGLITET